MVAPSCCLEYRPTAIFWLILFGVVFPSIYLSGKVVGCVLWILMRIIRGLSNFLLWDDSQDDEDIVEVTPRPSKSTRSSRDQRKKHRQRDNVVVANTSSQTILVHEAANGSSSKKKLTNGDSLDNKKRQPSNNSDSLISEDDLSHSTNGTIPPAPTMASSSCLAVNSNSMTSSSGLRHRTPTHLVQ